MKKIIIMLILLLVCFVPALAENTPEVIVDPSVKNFPNYIIDDIITEHPNAGVIHINKVERPCHLMRFQPVQVFLFIDIVI